MSLSTFAPTDAGLVLRISVLDNASNDGSAQMVESQFPQVRLVALDENLGFGAGNNRLAATSTATHLLLLNSDTVLIEEIVAPLLAALEADPAIAITAPRLIYPGGDVQMSSERFPTLAFEFARQIRGTKLHVALRRIFDAERVLRDHRRETELERRYAHDADFLWATCWLVRRADFPDGRIFDPAFPLYDEDLDVCRRLRTQGRRLRYVPETELVHIGGRSSPTSAAKSARMISGRTSYYRRYHGQMAAFAYRALAAAVSFAKGARGGGG